MIAKENGIQFALIRLILIKSNSLQKISQSFRTFEISFWNLLFNLENIVENYVTFRKLCHFYECKNCKQE